MWYNWAKRKGKTGIRGVGAKGRETDLIGGERRGGPRTLITNSCLRDKGKEKEFGLWRTCTAEDTHKPGDMADAREVLVHSAPSIDQSEIDSWHTRARSQASCSSDGRHQMPRVCERYHVKREIMAMCVRATPGST